MKRQNALVAGVLAAAVVLSPVSLRTFKGILPASEARAEDKKPKTTPEATNCRKTDVTSPDGVVRAVLHRPDNYGKQDPDTTYNPTSATIKLYVDYNYGDPQARPAFAHVYFGMPLKFTHNGKTYAVSLASLDQKGAEICITEVPR